MKSKRISKFVKNKFNQMKIKNQQRLPRKKELSLEQEKILEKNLVWVFASPRSGTSWLANQLLSYTTFQMDEPYIGFHLQTIGITENSQELIEYHKKRDTYFFSELYKDTWNYYLRKLILNRVYAQFQDLSKRIIIKEPNGSFGANNIIELLPTSKMILVLRDGRDIVDSLLDARSKDGWGATQGAGRFKVVTKNNRVSFIKRQSKFWEIRTHLLLSTFHKHDSNLRYKIKYEDLRKNTSDELKKIYDFIGIDISEDKIKKIVKEYSFENIPDNKKGIGKVTRSASPGKWKENFDEEEKNLMQEIMGKTLQELGYLN